MKKLFELGLTLLSCHVAVLSLIALVSAFSLAAAYIAEFGFGLEPCILCLYQRIPFAIALILAVAGLALFRMPLVGHVAIGLSGLAFLINSAIAFYHTGVEQLWWDSGVEGCLVDFGEGGENGDLLAAILKTPSVPCNVIPWEDPVLGLSMANYNVVLGLGMFALCSLSLFLIRQRPSPITSS